MTVRPTEVVGLRLLVRWGPGAIRVIAGLFWVFVLLQVILVYRPDLLYPAAIGSDVSNYAAAGERIVESELYRLSPGDRPVPADNPPDWAVPILSPPTVGTVWAALLPLGDLRFHLTWAVGVAATTGLVVFLIVRLPVVPLLITLYSLGAGLGVMAWSGNINAIAAPAIAALWFLVDPGRSKRFHVVAGVIVALLALMKLGPAVLGIWLLTRGSRDAAMAAIVTGILVIGASLVLGGVDPFVAYADIVRQAASKPSDLSIPGLLTRAGAPAAWGTPALVGLLIGAVVFTVAFRRHTRIAFAVAVVASVMSTTVVRLDTICVMTAALVPWAAGGQIARGSSRSIGSLGSIGVIGAGSVVVGIAAIVASVATGGLQRSSLSIANRTDRDVVVRLDVPGQDASFGFDVPAGVAGIAWRDRMGTARSDVFIFDRACRLVDRDPLGGRSTIDIGPSTDAPASPPRGFLVYTPLCAEGTGAGP